MILPKRSSILVTKIGVWETPELAKVDKALINSNNLSSAVPKQIEGTGGIVSVIPIDFTNSTTAAGEVFSFIKKADTQLIDRARALESSIIVPSSTLPEFLGVHWEPSGISKVTGIRGILVQGVNVGSLIKAEAYTKGLKVEPTCLLPIAALSYLKKLNAGPPT